MIDVTQLKPAWLWNLDEEGPPPTVERQVKRMFCLTAMTVLSDCVRGMESSEPRSVEAGRQYEDTVAWIKGNSKDELTLWEWKCVQSMPEQWGRQDLLNGSWAFQAAAMIGWALGLTNWRSAWEGYGPEDFEFPFIDSNLKEVRAMAKPRSQSEIELKNSVTCAWLWRCRQQSYLQTRNIFKRREYRKGLAEFVAELDKSGQFAPPINGDFNVGGMPFDRLSLKEHSRIHSLSTERLRALNWLVGQDPDYDAISCDT